MEAMNMKITESALAVKAIDESPLEKKLWESYKYFGGLCMLYGGAFAFCLYRNPNGITYPVLVLVTIVISFMMLKKVGCMVKKDSRKYLAGMILLGISTAMTQSWFLVFFNSVGILLFFLTVMLHQFCEDGAWSFPVYVKKLIKVCGVTLGHIFYPFTHGFRYLAGVKDGKRKNVAAVSAGILIAGVLLILVFPMLLKSDIIFAGIFDNLFYKIHFGTSFAVGLMILIGFIGSYAFFSALCSGRIDEEEEVKRKYYNPLVGITFSGILAGIYVLYAGIQVLYLFLRVGSRLPEGVTYAEYARQGFFELLFVAFVNFILVLVCKYLFDENRILSGILTVISGCTFVMIASAAYRMMMYVQMYHFTFLRILVLWFLFVLTLIMAGVTVSIYRKRFPLFRYVVAVIGCCYILLSFARPDRIVAEYNIRNMETVSTEDLSYMVYCLSDDAAPALAKLKTDEVEQEGKLILEEYFEEIGDRYENIPLRQWNLSKIQARKAAER